MDSLALDQQPLPSRFVVGIDLGTTNSAVNYVDTNESPWQVRTFTVAQLVDRAVVERRETLPSFHYQPAAQELGGLRLPWDDGDRTHVVGVVARDEGARLPGRQVASAKSWLCHNGVDRTADLLPWQAAEDVERLSPVEVSARYLRHIRQAWDHDFPEQPLAEQDVVLTLPASFDEVARELTVAAAQAAGLPRVVLIEEPQAAFYAWIDRHRDDWQSHVAPGQKILVCDIGGGTTDFTLIRVRSGEQGRIQFHRVAVGDHLILGGDNLDLALARHLERRLAESSSLTPRQWDALVGSCRNVKEQMLGTQGPASITINLPGGGSRLIGGGLQIPVTRDEVHGVLLDGFFPPVALEDRPRERTSGFQEFGLPYAADPAVTRYLAAFLTAHRHAGEEPTDPAPDAAADAATGGPGDGPGLPGPDQHDPARPDIVLFNGGLFAAETVRQRLLQRLEAWFRTPADPGWSPRVLENERLDLAVARGAAYYGMVRRGEGVRIAAGLARSYYIGVASQPPAAVCLVPGNAEPGQQFAITEPQFELLVRQPVQFPLYVSSVRLADHTGQVLTVDGEQMRSLPPIRTVLETRRKSDPPRMSVELHAGLTEIGTLELWCGESRGERRWRLQFDVRSATQTELEARETQGEQAGVLDEATWETFRGLLDATFGPHGRDAPEGLVKRLSAASGLDRGDWPPTLLRRMWDLLLQLQSGRQRSAVHEARWLNLLGYTLRPGYGLAVDDWRVAETWRTVQGKLVHPAAACRTESLILWRRIAGGLSAGQQRAVAEPLLSPVRALHRRTTTGKGRGGETAIGPHEAAEMLRLLGSLELLPGTVKVELGSLLLDLLPKPKLQAMRTAMCWTLGRLGARRPVYGPLNTVVRLEVVHAWLDRLLAARLEEPQVAFAIMQLARKTGDRYRDVSPRHRTAALDWLQDQQAAPHLVQLVRDGGELDRQEQGLVFGEALPIGLRIL
ncbi:MAG: Hsp70 family protein [Pirellulaceae bacterium]|nr:Hsp70 family protein [Pirellulaceae bacterium]